MDHAADLLLRRGVLKEMREKRGPLLGNRLVLLCKAARQRFATLWKRPRAAWVLAELLLPAVRGAWPAKWLLRL